MTNPDKLSPFDQLDTLLAPFAKDAPAAPGSAIVPTLSLGIVRAIEAKSPQEYALWEMQQCSGKQKFQALAKMGRKKATAKEDVDEFTDGIVVDAGRIDFSTLTSEDWSELEELAKLGSGARFKALKSKLARKPGIFNPGGLAAKIGRDKMGKKRFAKLAAAGK